MIKDIPSIVIEANNNFQDVIQNEFTDGLLPEAQWENLADYPDAEEIELPRGAETYDAEDGSLRTSPSIKGQQSIFNDYHLFKFKGSRDNSYPILESDQIKNSDLYTKTKLVDLINNPLGQRIYKPSDFLYLDGIGTPINKLITLRRFPYPCGDDITNKNVQGDKDVARMVTFMDDGVNKLSDLFKMSWGMKWRPLEAATEQAQMIGDQSGVNGYMKDILSFVDPKFGREAMQGQNALAYDPTHDQNRTHGPVDSISTTHIRDIGLNFTFDITIQFRYKLDSINGINGKAAFIDLISNILAVTMNNGKFWGGARYWTGARPSKYMNNLKFLSATSFEDFLNKGYKEVKSILGKFKGADAGKNAVDLLKTIAFNALNLGFGRLLDKIGRPSIPVMNSLLTNNPIGEWHLTIGNPLNPIATIGNMILIDSALSVGDSLGYDDFPDEILIECSLRPAMPRDRSGIESMFNMGKGRTYWKPSDGALSRRKSNNRGKNIPIPFNKIVNNSIDIAVSSVTGRYDASDARDNLKDIIYDFRKL